MVAPQCASIALDYLHKKTEVMTDFSQTRMPALFIGHGSPMNVLEDNVHTRTWSALGAAIPRPRAIVVISAHWTTPGTAVTAMATPRTIHDFMGFPRELYEITYPAPGDPSLAARVQSLLSPIDVQLDTSWGLDHGAWSVLVKMFPAADIPVIQLSLDETQPDSFHVDVGRRLAPLRDEGVLILGSGSVVHNLRTVRWNDNQPYDWATLFNDTVRDCLLRRDITHLADYAHWGPHAQLSAPTPEHFQPLLVVAGMLQEGEPVSIPTDGVEMGSLSMLSAAFGMAETA